MIEPYYEEPNIKIYCGDCLEIARTFPDNLVDLTITSPPYDNLRNYGGYSFDFEKTAIELYRITKNHGVVVWVIGDATINGNETGTSFKQALYFKEIGFNLHDTMIYGKKTYTPLTHNRYEQQFEYMFIFSKGKPEIFNPLKLSCKQKGKVKKSSWSFESGSTKENSAIRSGNFRKNEIQVVNETKIMPNIWFYNVGKNLTTKDSVAFKHPAIFPDKLAQDHIISWSNENNLILDPLLGSGTTLVACKELNRKGIGIEISKEYCDIAVQRLKNTTSNLL